MWLRGRRRHKKNDDYWLIDGNKAIRVHKQLRRSLYIPTIATTGGEGEPNLHQLGDIRTTRIKDRATQKVIEQVDDHTTVGSGDKQEEAWSGETEFEILLEVEKKGVIDILPLEEGQDRWEREGSTWTRCHNFPRRRLYHPEDDPGGPDPTTLENKRSSYIKGIYIKKKK